MEHPYLTNDRAFILHKGIIRGVGLDGAIVLEMISERISDPDTPCTRDEDGVVWVETSIRSLARTFPLISNKEVVFALKKLREAGLITTKKVSEEHKSPSHSINQDAVTAMASERVSA